jgi:hypothetical protein
VISSTNNKDTTKETGEEENEITNNTLKRRDEVEKQSDWRS